MPCMQAAFKQARGAHMCMLGLSVIASYAVHSRHCSYAEAFHGSTAAHPELCLEMMVIMTPGHAGITTPFTHTHARTHTP
eukprot:1160736-Pelagomonas_calceolata.AAC.4